MYYNKLKNNKIKLKKAITLKIKIKYYKKFFVFIIKL